MVFFSRAFLLSALSLFPLCLVVSCVCVLVSGSDVEAVLVAGEGRGLPVPHTDLHLSALLSPQGRSIFSLLASLFVESPAFLLSVG